MIMLRKFFSQRMMASKAVFLDRDGTINVHVPYISCEKDFSLIEGSAEAISIFNKNGFKVIVVTNQSGIGRGFFSKEILESIHEKMIFLMLLVVLLPYYMI